MLPDDGNAAKVAKVAHVKRAKQTRRTDRVRNITVPKILKPDAPKPPLSDAVTRWDLYDHERSNERLLASQDDLAARLESLEEWLKEICDQLEALRKPAEGAKLQEAMRRMTQDA